ncbi:MAG: sigma factor-like helix-turn-helix DNA-binding protein [Bacteroidales bacterium]
MIDIIRKESRVTTDHDYINQPVYEQGYSDLNEVLHSCLEAFLITWKSALLLRDYEGYSYYEISEITGQTEAQVKINIYRGRMASGK